MLESKYIWRLKESKEELVSTIANHHQLSTIMATILANRNIVRDEEIKRFLHVDRDKFHDPYAMKDMDLATKRILKAIANGEKITIYGDYDVDGMTSTSILYMYLKENNVQVDYYIPDRLEEGYGVNDEALKHIHDGGTSLVITVDTGITAISQAAYARDIGLDMIITDHHECQEEIPEAIAVIDPKREDCDYPFDMLAGCGVAFKLMHALSIKLDNTDLIWKYLDIVAVGTVADIVPLVDENRVITKLAFETMMDTWNVGLKALIEVSGTKKGDKISAGIIGFRIAPRLNAAGRLGDAKRGIALFTTQDQQEAAAIAETLNEENKNRQELEQKITEEAIEIIEETIDVANTKIIVVASKNWHHGVIGIVASRITEKYYRPTILLSIEDGVASGSARSVDGFSIFEALYSAKDILTKFGGHEMAAGMSLDEELVNALRDRVNSYAHIHMQEDTLMPKMHADMEISLDDINIPLIEDILKLEPYGMGNPEPKFICKGRVHDVRTIGKENNHLKMRLDDQQYFLDGIGFGMAEFYDYIEPSGNIALLGTLNINEWNGTKKPQIMLKDINVNNAYIKSVQEDLAWFKSIKSKGFAEGDLTSIIQERTIPDRKEYEHIYRALLALDKQEKHRVVLYKFLKQLQYEAPKSLIRFLLCLEVFGELSLLQYKIEDMELHFHLHKGIKVTLEQSTLYKKLS